MEFVSPIVESLKKHVGFLVYSTEYIEDMKKKLDQLNHMEKDIRENRSTQPHRKRKWLDDVKNLNERSNLIEEAKFFNVAKRYKLGKQSYGILQEIKDLEDRESKIEFTHAQRLLAEVGSTSTHPSTSTMATQDNFESRVSVFNDALQALQSNNESQKMIALCGMAGVGKTTMMEQLKKAVEDSGTFDWVVKVVIGEKNDPKSLQQAIAEYIGERLDETTVEARADRLRKIFETKSQQGQKKNLVIMDDIWKEVDLIDVGLSPLPNGFKLLLTSRFEDVCNKMGVRIDSIFRVRVLSDPEATTLFFTTVGPFPSDGDDDKLQRTGEDIVKKCGGLPIAIVTIAKTLSGDIEEAWEKALWRLERDDLKDLESITNRIFEMSYENLKEDEDKAIFLLSGLFPDDFNIRTEDLLRYGWGLSIFKDDKTLATARSHMKICVKNLIRANLLTESDENGCVKMHDLVRAFVLSNFSKVKQASITNLDKIAMERLAKNSYERILLKGEGMCDFPSDINYTNLSLLILMDGYEFSKFLQDIDKLEVVSYENMRIPVLLKTFEHSTTLQTLCLRSCSLTGDISSLGSLCNLETLSLVDCNIRRLPSAIGKLNKLKLLDLSGCVDLCIDEGVLQDLKGSLEELYMRASKGSPVKFTPANFHELEKLSQGLIALEVEFIVNKPNLKNMSFKSLERFRISIGFELKSYEKYSFRNTLNVVAECNELKECNIRDLFERTEELRLQVKYMIQFEDVTMHHKFSQLKLLRISECAELKYLFTVDVANGLKQLERLIISECPVLESLIGGVGVVTLKKLKSMSLEGLREMVSLCDNVIELPEMMELRLDGLPNVTSIYPDNNTISPMQSLFNKEDVTPKLEKLDISRMKNLKQIWPFQKSTCEKDDVSKLRQIIVRGCDRLTNVFPRNPLPLLNQLEEVVVKKCVSIEVLFNIDFQSVCGMGKYGSSRLRKIEVKELRKLKELWRFEGVNEFHTLINSFKDVQTIDIEDCANFTDIFTPTTTNFDLGALTTYLSRSNSGDLEERERRNEMTESDQEINVMSEVDDYIPDVTYPSSLLHTCPRLQHLKLWNDKSVGEVLFDMDSPTGSRQLATNQPPLLLPNLQSIGLSSLKKMSHVWKCNWNTFLIRHHPPLQFPFQNLTDIRLGFCDKIKYVLSPLMAKYLSNLKSVNIYYCDGMEEVISRRDDENTTSASSSYQDITFFPHLDTLTLQGLSCLKCIDDEKNSWSRSNKISSSVTNTIHDHLQSAQVTGSYWSLCQYPTKITIWGCDALSSVIPWYAAGQMKRLQELEISYCNGMREVFENELMNCYNTNNVDEGSAAGTSFTNLPLQNNTNVAVPQLSNLKTVVIYECDLLPHIFTFSTLKTLSHLKELKVKRCKTMQVIVKEENKTSSSSSSSSSEVVVFPNLETLELDLLPNLKGFFLGMNDFLLPSLVNVMINDCDEWVAFTSGQLETPKLKYLQTSFGKHNLEHGFNFQTTFPTSSKGMLSSFHNLIEINIENKKDVGRTIIPSHALPQLVNLQQITIGEGCDGLVEVFEVVAVEGSGSSESKTLVPIPNLTQVKLEEAKDLKYLWKSNQWMVLEFPNLTTLSIHYCERLEHVFTCSMVGSLVQLQDLIISDCGKIEVIVKGEEEEECDAKVNEIILPRLNSLKLDDLSRLKGFCLGKEAFSLPALDTLHIKDCPDITVFTKGHLSTPQLKVIDTNFGICDVRTDVNSFIETKQEEGHKFSS
ncbi:putative AAA+ ATPase domain, P-loop containing nucleoside triphosphate hydrolase [Helianthus debilis subsp. tardiflorus]